jgi:hypothetical protein
MVISYICHPISGDIPGNIEKLIKIARKINLEEQEVIAFVPYFMDLHCLDDQIPEERARGIKNDTELIRRQFVDEVRLYGPGISSGMWHEIRLARELGIRIRPMSKGTTKDFINGDSV